MRSDTGKPEIRLVRVCAPNRPDMNREPPTGVEGWAELHALNRALRVVAGLPPDPVIERSVVNRYRRVPK